TARQPRLQAADARSVTVDPDRAQRPRPARARADRHRKDRSLRPADDRSAGRSPERSLAEAAGEGGRGRAEAANENGRRPTVEGATRAGARAHARAGDPGPPRARDVWGSGE